MSNQADYDTKVLEVRNLKQYFKVGVGSHKLEVKAVDDVSFDVYKKEVFGLVGESGCGKTTTGRTLLRLYKPTSGVVKLNSKIIASGSGDFKKAIREEKHAFQAKKRDLNQRKHDIYKLNLKYQKDIKQYKEEIEKLKKDFEVNKQKVEADIIDYREKLFKENNQYRVELEELLFQYKNTRDKIIAQTKNFAEFEFQQLVKGLKTSINRKIEGIKESAALSSEAKENHIAGIKVEYDERYKQLNEEFEPKIRKAQDNILSKADSKAQIAEIKADYLKKKAALIEKHNQFKTTIKKPNFVDIRAKVLVQRKQLLVETRRVKEKIARRKQQLKLDISHVTSSNVVNQEELLHLKEEHEKKISELKEQIRLSNMNHSSQEAKENVRNIQMIFQDPISSLNPRMTVQEIVSEGLVINGMTNKEELKTRVAEALKLVGLAPEYITRYPHEFSGGQRQRIGIARALIMDPKIIVADEPISALDVSIQAQVINLLQELKEKLDLTILFIAHDLSVVKFFCDRIAVMYYGKIMELATAEELFKHPLHGYTKSLLSAIPHPDPDYEKVRRRVPYSPASHDYSVDKPKFVEIRPGHFVRANEAELEKMRLELGEDND